MNMQIFKNHAPPLIWSEFEVQYKSSTARDAAKLGSSLQL